MNTPFRLSLVKTSTGWTLTRWESRVVTTFNADGYATKVTDRNGNVTSLTNLTSSPKVTGWSGPASARVNTVTNTGYEDQVTVGQDPANPLLQMTLAASNGLYSTVTDLGGATTDIAYTPEGRIASIDAPATGRVSFVYDGAGRLAGGV